MTQEITVTKTEDHYEMQFEGNDTAYPVPTSAIDKLDGDLLPEETGDSLTFVGEYGGHKHMKNFDVEEVLDAPGEEESGEEEAEVEEEESAGGDEGEESAAEPTDEHVEEVGYNVAAGQAQQIEAQRLFGTGEDGSEAAAQESSEPSNSANTDSEKRVVTDGGREEWLLYGQPADVIDEPEKVFARRNDEFFLMPMSLFDESVIEDNEHVPGEIFLDGISADDGYFDIVDQLEPVDVDDLITDLVEETVFSEREAQMVVLGGWFGMDRQKIAEHLDLSKHTVRNHIEAAKTRYQKAKATKGNMFNL